VTFNFSRMRPLVLVVGAWAVAVLVPCDAVAVSANGSQEFDLTSNGSRSPTDSAVGEEFQPCDGCPTFIRVPHAPGELRRVMYVAKYPLTWRHYLKPVREGACLAPSRTYEEAGRTQRVGDYLDELEIDWPVTILTPEEVGCYKDWLDGQLELSVEIPSESEWNWFALGDMVGSRFPWGNEAENPPAAVRGVEIDSDDILTGISDQAGYWLVSGVRIGLFQPNSWGLYDVVGNEYQLTSTAFSGRDWYARHPYSHNAGKMLNHEVFIVKGGSVSSRLPETSIVESSNSVRVIDGRYSANVSVRFILISGDENE